MSQFKKPQDMLGVFLAIGVTAMAVGFALSGNAFVEEKITIKTTSPTQEIIGIGGIGDTDDAIRISLQDSALNLDSSDGFLRGIIEYDGYVPQYGKVYMEIYSVNKGEMIHKSDLLLSQRGSDTWEADFLQYFDKEEMRKDENNMGQYIIRVSSDAGKLAKQASFSLDMPSIVQLVQEVKPIKTAEVGFAGILGSKSPSNDVSILEMETNLENAIVKRYLSEILEKYYDGQLTVDDVDKLAQFENIDCNLQRQNTDANQFLELDCKISPVK